MKQEYKTLREKLAEMEKQVTDARRILKFLEKNCKHNYGPTLYAPIITDTYTIPGDAPGTMGVDWRGPVYVPREERPRWKRECLECGLVEYTQEVKEKIERTPSWSIRNKSQPEVKK